MYSIHTPVYEEFTLLYFAGYTYIIRLQPNIAFCQRKKNKCILHSFIKVNKLKVPAFSVISSRPLENHIYVALTVFFGCLLQHMHFREWSKKMVIHIPWVGCQLFYNKTSTKVGIFFHNVYSTMNRNH